MPTPTRVAVILLALLAVLLLADAALTRFAQDVLVDRLTTQQGAAREAVARQLLLSLVAYAVVGASAPLAAVFLARRRTWARTVGVLVMSLLAVASRQTTGWLREPAAAAG